MVVTLLHVLLKVLSEVEQGFLYLALKLVMKTKEEMAITRSWAVIPALLLSRAQDGEEAIHMPQPRQHQTATLLVPRRALREATAELSSINGVFTEGSKRMEILSYSLPIKSCHSSYTADPMAGGTQSTT